MEEELTFNDQIELEHLLFSERKCRVCGKVKNLVDDFYLTRNIKEHYHQHIRMSVRLVPYKELQKEEK